MKERVVTGVILAALAIAFITKPSEADFEAHVEKKFAETQSKAMAEGNVVSVFLGTGMEMTRSGQYKDAVLSSTYYVTYLGNPVYKCTGVFGYISCGDAQ